MNDFSLSVSSASVDETTGEDAEQTLVAAVSRAAFDLDEAQFVVVAMTEHLDGSVVRAAIQSQAPNAAILGMTSCLGSMTDHDVIMDAAGSISLLAIRDGGGDYGAACAAFGDLSPKQVARDALKTAVARAGRQGEVPDAVWLSATPGFEEEVVAGLQDVVGTNVPIMGGSAADNSVAGAWMIFDSEQTARAGLAVAALYPSVPVGFTFHSGYAPTGEHAQVTAAHGRRLVELDGEPAATVYNRWSNGAIDDVLAVGGDALMLSSLHPLGRREPSQTFGGIDDYVLSHPAKIHADGSMDLFTEIEVGDHVEAMSGTPDNLASRAGRVALNARRSADIAPDELSGALIIYCAGCMLTIKDRMNEVAESLNTALNGTPFLGMFTFGEQGCFTEGSSRHGNLMISALVFGTEG